MRLLLFFLVTSITIFFSCNTTEPEMKVQYPPGYQHDIPWPSLADSPWPTERGDAQGTGRSRSIGPKLGKVTMLFDSVEIYSGFAVGSDSTIYTSGIFRQKALSGIHLIAIGKDNKLKYAVKVTNPFKNFLTPICLSDGSVIFGDDNPVTGGAVLCCDKDGNIKWRYQFSEILQTASLGIDKSGNIYAVTVKHKLYVLDRNGNLLWDLQLETGKDIYTEGCVFSPDGKKLYVSGSFCSLIAVDINSRQIVWKKGDFWSGTIPLIDNDGNIYISGKSFSQDTGRYITKLDPDGNIVWQYYIGPDRNISYPEPALDRFGNLYCTNLEKLFSIKVTGELNWEKEIPGIRNIPLTCDEEGNVYVFTEGAVCSLSKSGQFNLPVNSVLLTSYKSRTGLINGKLFLCSNSKLVIIE